MDAFLHFLLNLSLVCCFAERFNKKCKNLTANKHLPMQSLANALVRDNTARFFRWKRGAPTTRQPKIPVTEVVGSFDMVEVPDQFHASIQRYLICGCRLGHSAVYEYVRAKIGGKSFNAGERLSPGVRCGSVVTKVTDGRSVYGLVKKFYRVMCACHSFIDFALLTWFPLPNYPDGDPLTIKIILGGLNVNNIPRLSIVPLNDIHPSRIGVELDNIRTCMYMLRFDGTDTMPTV